MIETECGGALAGGRRRPRGPGPLQATVVVEPAAAVPPAIDTSGGSWMDGINRMAAESEAANDSFLGDGFVGGPDRAVATGKPYAPASTTIDRSGRVEHVSWYRDTDESGSICFPIEQHCRRAETVIKIAGGVMLAHGYAGKSRVVMNIYCPQKSRIMTTEGFCFYHELESVDSEACLGFGTQRAWVFTSRQLRDGCGEIAKSRIDAFVTLYAERGKYVRHSGAPV